MDFKEVEINTDSTMVVEAIKSEKLHFPSGCSLVKEMRHIGRNWKIDIVSCFREVNRCADVLANWSCSLDMDIIVFDDCPSLIRKIYDSDIRVITTPRLIVV